MADSENGYQVGPCRPPLHTRFKKGQSGAGAVREAAKAAIEKLGAEIQQAGTERTVLRRQAQIPGRNDQRSLSRPSHSRGDDNPF
jgi:hypothetical protein